MAAAGQAPKPVLASGRLRREERTLAAMIGINCRDHHGAARAAAASVRGSNAAASPLCSDCAALLDYARTRLARCPYGTAKPTCAKCPTHCYKPAMREQVRAVMRHSGPRMIKRHPLLAAAHLVDGRRKPPRR
jgi:hypothetical protein